MKMVCLDYQIRISIAAWHYGMRDKVYNATHGTNHLVIYSFDPSIVNMVYSQYFQNN